MLDIINKNSIKTHKTISEKISDINKLISAADAVVIGAGAGLSAAGGLCYTGDRFYNNFGDFIKAYGMTDMYTAGFYPFRTQNEKWAYWSRHIMLNRYMPMAAEVYIELLTLVKNKEYFVITTNVDAQFYKAGFEKNRIWAVQGDYGRLQCSVGCHNKLYDNEAIVTKMVNEQSDCKIPDRLIPQCPVCGGNMEVNIRKDMYFVQDEDWYSAANEYESFLKTNKNKSIVFLELGVGYNTPGIIRYPFEKYAKAFKNSFLIRINLSRHEIPSALKNKSISLDDDIADVIHKIYLSRKEEQ